MRAILPGQPESRLQALCNGRWDDQELIVYITGNAFVILAGPDQILQTIYDEDGSSLECVAIDEGSGKIAVSTGPNVRIYKPYGLGEAALKWALQATVSSEDSEDRVTSLSWGGPEELLVGSSTLTLYATESFPEPSVSWTTSLANRVKIASLSYDSAYIASSGCYDRLVKIWRRLSYGSDDVRFDITYLPHPKVVTDLHWRRPYHQDQTIDNVLFTFCADNVMRIWNATDPHSLHIFQLWGSVDLQESIQIRTLDSGASSEHRYAFIVDGRDFSRATETAVQNAVDAGQSEQDYSLEHLIEVANRSPEVCVVLDENGNMSAWGLENVGGKVQQSSNIFNIVHVSGLQLNVGHSSGHSGYVRLCGYHKCGSKYLNILVHRFDSGIECYESNPVTLFVPSERSDRVLSKAQWAGHSSAIKKIVRDITGKAAVSRTDNNECHIWRQDEKTALVKRSSVNPKDHIRRICVMKKGDFVVFLHDESISLWDCHGTPAKLRATKDYTSTGKPLCLLVLPEVEHGGHIAHLATITSTMKGIVWEVKFPNPKVEKNRARSHGSVSWFCDFDLGGADDLAYVLPVDSAGSPPVISGFLDTFARDVAISYTHEGMLRSWTAKIDTKLQKVTWLQTSSVETGVSKPALASGSSIRKAAMVNSSRSELTIWDLKGAQLEYVYDFEDQNSIQDLDWTSTPDSQSILAVGFQHRVVLITQLRYDYLNKSSAWAIIREINIRDLTPHPIGDSVWLGSGSLVVGAGHQLFVYDRSFSESLPLVKTLRKAAHKEHFDLFEVVTQLNGPLPVFHPQFLSQCVLAGKLVLVHCVLLALYKALKYHVEGESIDHMLGMDLEDFYSDSELNATTAAKKDVNSFAEFSGDEDSDTMTEAVATTLMGKLTEVSLPQLSGQIQIQLADIIECVTVVEKQRRSMDENAARFMLFFRQHTLRKGRGNEVSISWREINWSFHSNSQDILADMVSKHFHGRMTWENARESGLFMWISDLPALKIQFENIARNEYSKTDLKNPIDCSLFYLALRKKTVLQGLWRMAGWNKEQAATLRLLGNNFQDLKWREVALKNAYALLGKRRFEYAAAWFLLADSLKDAVNVCINQIKDLQLAIAIIRVYEGDDGPTLREVLEDKVLPLAAQEGNRWLASWAFWMLHRRDMAVRALITPVYTLVDSPEAPDQQAKMYLTDDPALVVLYSQLRQKTLQTLKGASQVTPKVEWEFVLHSARIYDRMGCDLLALDLVRNWEFLLPTPKATPGHEADPRKMLRRRSSLVVADLPSPLHAEGLRKPPPSVFEEPESNSLLDSFGF